MVHEQKHEKSPSEEEKYLMSNNWIPIKDLLCCVNVHSRSIIWKSWNVLYWKPRLMRHSLALERIFDIFSPVSMFNHDFRDKLVDETRVPQFRLIMWTWFRISVEGFLCGLLRWAFKHKTQSVWTPLVSVTGLHLTLMSNFYSIKSNENLTTLRVTRRTL